MNDTILTITEVATLLKMKETQVYTMLRRRSQLRMGENAIPYFKVNGNVRFSANAIHSWIEKMARPEIAA